MTTSIASAPCRFPLDGPLCPDGTALVVVDMQADFLCAGGLTDRLGLDWRALAAAVPAASRLLAACRAAGLPVIHTREGFAPDLADAQAVRLWRGPDGRRPVVGDAGPLGRHLVRDEPGWQIVPEVAPLAGEVVLDKPSHGAFVTTDIDDLLWTRGIHHLIVCGVTSDCCLRAIVGEALDRGYDCLTVSDASAATDPAAHAAAMEQIRSKGGMLGAVADSATVLRALEALGAAGLAA